MINKKEFADLLNQWDVVLPPYDVFPTAFSRNQGEVFDWGHTYLRAQEVYGQTRGAGVAIAILDTAGTFADHPDLKDNSLEEFAKNYSNSEEATDVHGHGTHCAGIAAAVNNGFGVIGAAPDAKLIPVKVLNDKGAGSYSWIAQGIRYVADLNIPNIKHKILSLSLGGSSGSSTLKTAIQYAIAKGCYVIAAAGNSYRGENTNSMNYPARYDEVIAVGSINRDANPSSFSSAGPQVDVVAPGESIYSTHKGKTYAYLSGTSMATPYIAGVVALLAAVRNDLPDQASMHNHLRTQAKDIFRPGFDNRTGFGVPFVPLVLGMPSTPPTTTLPPPTTTTPKPDPQPQDPVKEARALNFGFDGPYTVVWQAQNSSSKSAGGNTRLTFRGSEVNRNQFANPSAQRILTITRIDFTFDSTTLADLEYDRAKEHFRWFFTSRGFVLEANSDFRDALYWTRHFLQNLLKRRRNFEIEVTYIHGVDEEGREVYLD